MQKNINLRTGEQENMKVLAIIGIVASGFLLIGSVALIAEGDSLGVPSFLMYGFYLALSIVSLISTKKVAK